MRKPSTKPARKSWREKLADDKGLPKLGRVEGHKVRLGKLIVS